MSCLEPTTRIERVTSSLPRTCSGQLSYVGELLSLQFFCYFLQPFSDTLQNLGGSLPAERETGFEPATSSLEGWSSTN